MEPEPIPLRTLTVLLSYEFVTSDPRFFSTSLVKTSLADPQMITRLRTNFAEAFKNVPKTIEKTNFQIFEPYFATSNVKHHSTTCSIHPSADKTVKSLNHARRELLFYQTRCHDGCYKAGGLYQFFFELCPPGQTISIQLAEEEPVIVDPQTRQLIELEIQGPKLNSITTVVSGPPLNPISTATYNNGQKDNEGHLIIVFPNPQHPDDAEQGFVVDMTRLQYGQAGRGLHGENYFLGTFTSWNESMKSVCAHANLKGTIKTELKSAGNSNEERLRACAKKVWERWQNRETEGWCAFCGKPGNDLKKCSACTTRQFFYCCNEHQKSDWKLHKHTCEKNRK